MGLFARILPDAKILFVLDIVREDTDLT